MKFTLRDWVITDAAGFQKYADNKKIAQNMSDGFPHPCTLKGAEKLLNSFICADKQQQLSKAIIVKGEVAGSIGVFKKSDIGRKTAEIGYWLGEPFWGNGIMRQAIEQVVKEAFAALDIVRIEADVFAPNKASQRTLEKAGFTLEGTKRKSVYKNGHIYDSKVYALLDEDLKE